MSLPISYIRLSDNQWFDCFYAFPSGMGMFQGRKTAEIEIRRIHGWENGVEWKIDENVPENTITEEE